MATNKATIAGIECIASDWNNYLRAVQKNVDSVNINVIIDRIAMIQNHPCAALISIPFMFSYYKKKYQQQNYDWTNQQCCHTALFQVSKILNSFLKDY